MADEPVELEDGTDIDLVGESGFLRVETSNLRVAVKRSFPTDLQREFPVPHPLRRSFPVI